MNALSAFFQLLFGPLELLFETVFGIAYNIVGNPGIAIIPLSLCMNLLALPFYNRADLIQKEERDRQQQMAPNVSHIKYAFKGDERYMMLQAYYRIVGYKPLYSLRSSLPLLLEIPFFVAAYHFLSNLPDLNGAALGPLMNLALPDKLFKVGSISINLLPILMTLINLLSSTIYSKGLSKKDKIQLYGIALIFLVLLYNSPSGLVFYWTLNQIFSLSKNVVSAAKNRRLVAGTIFSAIGAIVLVYAFAAYGHQDLNQLLLCIIGFGFQIPIIHYVFGKGNTPAITEGKAESKSNVFIFGCLFMTVLTGILIPSAVIKASPSEFVVLSEYHSPLLYVFSAFLLASGTFMIWLGLFYYLATPQAKRIMEASIWIISVFAVVNYMFFGTNLGNLSAELKYDMGLAFSVKDYLINSELLLVFGTVALVLWLKKGSIVKAVLPILIIAVVGMSIYNLVGINAKIPQIKSQMNQVNEEKASFRLSKKGKNVIVFMLDRGISGYIPYLLQEKPELVQQFDGFTWYPNTLSYGTRTNTGSPALFGGYEYTPEEINKRDTERLVDKQNEALKVMPIIFRDAGYEVTVCDPPYAGYTWIPDLSIFDGYEGIKAYNTENGEFSDQKQDFTSKQQIWNRNLFCYSIMKVSPLIMQTGLYQDGTYFNPHRMDSLLRQTQLSANRSVAFGVWDDFMNSYAAICSLSSMTEISEADQDTFLMMNNGTPHNAILLQEPQYEPQIVVDNTEYDEAHEDRFIFDGRPLLTETEYQMRHYQSNMAAWIQIGKWFDYLRENGVYDNTRIIIVADHGWPLEQFEDMLFGKKDAERTIYNPEDVMAYNPLLLVKDFNSKGFKVDYAFMTNADTPTIALEGLVQNPVNPFTEKPINAEAKEADEQHVFYTDMWGTEQNNGNTFLPGFWYSLKNHNIFDTSNWSALGVY